MKTVTRMRGAALAIALVALLATPAMADTLMTFEEFVGNDAANIGTFYSGITFTTMGSGSDWKGRDANSNNYNISSTNGGEWLGGYYWIHGYAGATTALDSSGNGGTIEFDNEDATYVQLAYCAAETFYLKAYDTNGNLLDMDSGPANRRYIEGNNTGPGTLRVDWNGTDYISYVVVHDAGNYWVVDNILTDATGIGVPAVPLPAAAWLGFALLGGLGAVRRLRRRK